MAGILAALSLGLGIGANTAIFSLMDALLVKLLPVREPQSLVLLTDPSSSGVSQGTQGGVRTLLSYGEYGGNINLRINGDCWNAANFADLNGESVGGVTVFVTDVLFRI